MKKILAVTAAAALAVSLFTACGTQTAANGHTLYFKDASKSREAVATFFNSDTGASTDVTMTKIAETDDSCTFSCTGDTAAYNMAYVTYDGLATEKFAFNKCVSGWFSSEKGFLPYAEGKENTYRYHYADVTLPFNGYEKTIHIWTPDDYDANAAEPYGTIYTLDGQSADFLEPPAGHTVAESECTAAQVQSMMAVTDAKAIIVAVETEGDPVSHNFTRDDELIPDLGTMAHEEGSSKKCAKALADFLAETLVPYVRAHYNVYADARHTAVNGVSLGGLGAFYIALEHPECFGTAGVLSPSFWTYDDAAWRQYLGGKATDGTAPFLYVYSGGKNDTGKEATEMVERLRGMGYPAEKIAYHYNENGGHAVPMWRSVYAEFLEAMVFQQVEGLQS